MPSAGGAGEQARRLEGTGSGDSVTPRSTMDASASTGRQALSCTELTEGLHPSRIIALEWFCKTVLRSGGPANLAASLPWLPSL